MEETQVHDQRTLEKQLARTRERLDGLLGELRGIDCELEALSEERKRYDALQQAWGALQQLDQLGGSQLFWGDASPESTHRDHLASVLGRLDAFQKKLGEIEDRRETVVEETLRVQEDSEYIEYDLDVLREEEERRKLEWVVEREMGPDREGPSVMPWTRGGEDDQRFRRTLAIALAASVILALIFPFIDLPVPGVWKADEVPDRLTRLLQEERPAPPPPPVAQETLQQESTPEPSEQAKPVEKAPKPETATKGILAFREQFSELASSLSSARLGSEARIRNPGEKQTGRSERSLVATRGSTTSGGIDVSSLSRDVGGGGGTIERVAVTRATSSIGGTGTADRPLSNGPGPGRTDEEIQIVFDRHKAALYRLYNRELRRNPTLQGQMVLRLTIEPDGSVSLCELQSTDMKAPQLVSQVLGRVSGFDFGAKEGVAALTILYPIDFLPAT